MKPSINIVWLKRDLRLNDHRPFFDAESHELDYIAIYVFEPSILDHPDSSIRHQQFVFQSILEMNERLEKYDREILMFHSEALEVFDFINDSFKVNQVFSYEESGVQITWDRDKKAQSFFDENGIFWKEYKKGGVVRGSKNRNTWDHQWHEYVNAEVIQNRFTKSTIVPFSNPFPIEENFRHQLKDYSSNFQFPGEKKGWRYLKSFCEDRGRNYSRLISKPLESRKSCGRISPYLAWGNLSIRQAYQFVKRHPNYNSNKRSFNGLLTRLKWHCHFIQKFEVECRYETKCVNSGYELMEYTNDESKVEAWKKGETGFPLIDACMRCLKETGWINFRMRAMLVSFLCHHLDCDWRKGTYHLAQLFLDYEPGIHFTQFQMQAGTTGINTIRMYNPVKQSKDHDPEGVFIKMWVKELQNVPLEFIHEPWQMTPMDRSFNNVEHKYPEPIIDIEESGKTARAKIWGFKKHEKVVEESNRIILLHTRNNRKKLKVKSISGEKK